MKAIICTKYGPPNVLKIKEVAKPVPKDNQVLVKVHATTVTAGDCEIRRFDFPPWLWLMARIGFGITGPRMKILGQELSGEIVEVGNNVKRFKVGDQVFGSPGFSLGAHAEYITLPEKGMLSMKPSSMSHDEAAAAPIAGLEAVYYLNKAKIEKGTTMLIRGAGGSIGTLALQLAKSRGAEVTAVDSAEKQGFLLGLGADAFIDYTTKDYTQDSKKYNVILDVVRGGSFSANLTCLSEDGYFLLVNPTMKAMIRGRSITKKTSKTIIVGASGEEHDDLDPLKDLLEKGKLKVVIDKRFPLEKMAEAHEYAESGRKKGNIVINVGQHV